LSEACFEASTGMPFQVVLSTVSSISEGLPSEHSHSSRGSVSHWVRLRRRRPRRRRHDRPPPGVSNGIARYRCRPPADDRTARRTSDSVVSWDGHRRPLGCGCAWAHVLGALSRLAAWSFRRGCRGSRATAPTAAQAHAAISVVTTCSLPPMAGSMAMIRATMPSMRSMLLRDREGAPP
jgi:hypothetical protein